MSKQKYDIKNIANEGESSFELDLAPMLALMVTLIPIMLLSTEFVKVAVIETPLPQAVEQAIQDDNNKKKRTVNVSLKMSQKAGFSLVVRENGRTNTVKIPKKSGNWDLERLYTELESVKQRHPNVFRVDLLPAEDVPYKDIVKAMDEARHIKSGRPKVKIMDSKQNKMVETDAMFPNMVFANVVEG
jgi:biopolymer transport protein ExbD